MSKSLQDILIYRFAYGIVKRARNDKSVLLAIANPKRPVNANRAVILAVERQRGTRRRKTRFLKSLSFLRLHNCSSIRVHGTVFAYCAPVQSNY
jgi:hypothetical protein